MKIIYSSKQTEEICTDFKKAKKFFGGQEKIALSLHARINALKNATALKDIIIQPQMRFHKLYNKGKNNNLLGYYAIDVKNVSDKWRLIIRPLDDDFKGYIQCDIDKIADSTKNIEIKEVSNHYE